LRSVLVHRQDPKNRGRKWKPSSIPSRGSLLFFKKFKFSNFGCACVFFPRILLVKNLVHSLTFEGAFNEARIDLILDLIPLHVRQLSFLSLSHFAKLHQTLDNKYMSTMNKIVFISIFGTLTLLGKLWHRTSQLEWFTVNFNSWNCCRSSDKLSPSRFERKWRSEVARGRWM
jgi:hypothetical protein